MELRRVEDKTDPERKWEVKNLSMKRRGGYLRGDPNPE